MVETNQNHLKTTLRWFWVVGRSVGWSGVRSGEWWYGVRLGRISFLIAVFCDEPCVAYPAIT